MNHDDARPDVSQLRETVSHWLKNGGEAAPTSPKTRSNFSNNCWEPPSAAGWESIACRDEFLLSVVIPVFNEVAHDRRSDSPRARLRNSRAN